MDWPRGVRSPAVRPDVSFMGTRAFVWEGIVAQVHDGQAENRGLVFKLPPVFRVRPLPAGHAEGFLEIQPIQPRLGHRFFPGCFGLLQD